MSDASSNQLPKLLHPTQKCWAEAGKCLVVETTCRHRIQKLADGCNHALDLTALGVGWVVPIQPFPGQQFYPQGQSIPVTICQFRYLVQYLI
jgi:hypothetical protein